MEERNWQNIGPWLHFGQVLKRTLGMMAWLSIKAMSFERLSNLLSIWQSALAVSLNHHSKARMEAKCWSPTAFYFKCARNVVTSLAIVLIVLNVKMIESMIKKPFSQLRSPIGFLQLEKGCIIGSPRADWALLKCVTKIVYGSSASLLRVYLV